MFFRARKDQLLNKLPREAVDIHRSLESCVSQTGRENMDGRCLCCMRAEPMRVLVPFSQRMRTYLNNSFLKATGTEITSTPHQAKLPSLAKSRKSPYLLLKCYGERGHDNLKPIPSNHIPLALIFTLAKRLITFPYTGSKCFQPPTPVFFFN